MQEHARSATKREILNHHYSDFMHYINVRQLLHRLIPKRLLTSEEVDYLSNSTRTEQECIRYLLEVIPRKGPNAFDLFVTSLSEEKDHRGHQYLAKKLTLAMRDAQRDLY